MCCILSYIYTWQLNQGLCLYWHWWVTRRVSHLVRVVQQGTVVTLVSHSVHVGVLLVGVVDVRAVILLVQNLCSTTPEKTTTKNRIFELGSL